MAAQRTFAIGDIHGCLEHFDALLDRIALTPVDHLILLGDYVDRGPNSAGVLDRLLQLSRQYTVTALMGNHEQMMLSARSSRDKFSDWLQNGGDTTLRSYAGTRARLQDVTSSHWEFLKGNLVDYFETDSHIFVHAGAYPDMPMQDQPEYMLRWERFETIAAHESGKTIICGHTPQKSGRPCNRGYSVCLDTYACGGMYLTCMEMSSGAILQADARGHVQRSHISDFGEE